MARDDILLLIPSRLFESPVAISGDLGLEQYPREPAAQVRAWVVSGVVGGLEQCVNQTKADIRQAFQRAGLRVTRQREAVYAALMGTRSHPTAEDLHETVRSRGNEPSISLATVYNTLEALSQAGLCRRLPCSCGATRFDADLKEHVHIVLTDGRVLDLPENLARSLIDSLPSDLTAQIAAHLDLPISSIGLQIVAHNPACNANENT